MKLVLLPGMHGKEALLDDFATYLSADADPEVIALPDHGRQSYSRLAELSLDWLPRDEDYVLLAESFSSVIAKKIVELRPPRLRGLVLVSAFFSCPNLWLQQAAGWVPLGVLQRSLRSRMMLRLLFTGSQVRPEVLDQIREAFVALPADVLQARMETMISLRPGGTQIRVPTCYIQPVEDRWVDERCVREVKQTLRDGLVCKVEAPHFALQVQPALCASIVNHFLLRLPERMVSPAGAPAIYRTRVGGARRLGGFSGEWSRRE